MACVMAGNVAPPVTFPAIRNAASFSVRAHSSVTISTLVCRTAPASAVSAVDSDVQCCAVVATWEFSVPNRRSAAALSPCAKPPLLTASTFCVCRSASPADVCTRDAVWP